MTTLTAGILENTCSMEGNWKNCACALCHLIRWSIRNIWSQIALLSAAYRMPLSNLSSFSYPKLSCPAGSAHPAFRLSTASAVVISLGIRQTVPLNSLTWLSISVMKMFLASIGLFRTHVSDFLLPNMAWHQQNATFWKERNRGCRLPIWARYLWWNHHTLLFELYVVTLKVLRTFLLALPFALTGDPHQHST